jgi:hypothetical protein
LRGEGRIRVPVDGSRLYPCAQERFQLAEVLELDLLAGTDVLQDAAEIGFGLAVGDGPQP